MKLLLVQVAIIGLAIASCDARAQKWKRGVDIQPVQVDEIEVDDAQLAPNEVPLVAELINDNPDNSFVPSDSIAINSDRPSNIDIYPTNLEGLPPNADSETMETASTIVFRPLFAYRKQNVERRSLNYRRQTRRGEGPSAGGGGGGGGGAWGAGVNNYFSNPPPYLVYNRKTGAYFPYYNYTNYNKNVRRS